MLSALLLLLAATVLAASAESPCKRSSKPDLLWGGGMPPRLFNGALPPRVTYMPEPEYDAESRRTQIQGAVILSVELDGNGKLNSVRPVKSRGHSLKEPEKCSVPAGCPLPPTLVRNAVENVRHWVFEPACKDGHGVPTAIDVEVTFLLY